MTSIAQLICVLLWLLKGKHAEAVTPCERGGDYWVVDSEDCRIGHRCSQGVLVNTAICSAAANLVFDENINGCNFRHELPADYCDRSAIKIAITTTTTSIATTSTINSISHVTTTSTQKQTTEIHVTTNPPFDNINNGFSDDCVEGEFYPHPNDCSKFFQCANKALVEKQCPLGLVFDPNLSVCVNPNGNSCQSVTGNTASSQPSTTTSFDMSSGGGTYIGPDSASIAGAVIGALVSILLIFGIIAFLERKNIKNRCCSKQGDTPMPDKKRKISDVSIHIYQTVDEAMGNPTYTGIPDKTSSTLTLEHQVNGQIPPCNKREVPPYSKPHKVAQTHESNHQTDIHNGLEEQTIHYHKTLPKQPSKASAGYDGMLVQNSEYQSVDDADAEIYPHPTMGIDSPVYESADNDVDHRFKFDNDASKKHPASEDGDASVNKHHVAGGTNADSDANTAMDGYQIPISQSCACRPNTLVTNKPSVYIDVIKSPTLESPFYDSVPDEIHSQYDLAGDFQDDSKV